MEAVLSCCGPIAVFLFFFSNRNLVKPLKSATSCCTSVFFKCEGLLLFSVIYERHRRVFLFWIVGETEKANVEKSL